MSKLTNRDLPDAVEIPNSITLSPVSANVTVLEGQVVNHKRRKQIHRVLKKNSRTIVLNQLAVSPRRDLRPRALVGRLKRDEQLAGVQLSYGAPNYKSTLHVDLTFNSEGEVIMHGVSPSHTYSSYLESRLWLAPGVCRVTNLTRSIGDRQPPDVEQVMHQLLETETPEHIRDAVSADARDEVLTLSGEVDGTAHRTLAEHCAWAIPQVQDVDNQLKIAS